MKIFIFLQTLSNIRTYTCYIIIVSGLNMVLILKKKKQKRGSAALMIFNDQIRKAAGFYSVRKILISCKFVSNLALLWKFYLHIWAKLRKMGPQISVVWEPLKLAFSATRWG